MSPETKLTPNAFAGLLAPVESPAPVAPALDDAPAAVDKQVVAEQPQSQPAQETAPKKARSKKKTDPEAAASQPVVEVEAPAKTPKSEPATSGGEVSTGANPYHPINISLPLSINERYEAYKQTSGSSHPEILFDAIDATAEQLPDLIRAKYGEVKASSLFNRPNRTMKTFAPEEKSKTFIVRVREDNANILEDLWRQLGAPNRNAMIVVAYDEFLPKTEAN